ncbi:MAG: L-2-hydroxyglutarate oxidase [Bacteroidetes bacterium]|jgi:L-2-hydroxyglutarate oxidase|nr:L-2-hydroxyglutarate oxidase [Bacteroidota bacterium]MDF1864516.1 L-2-hydroxyglutarate oxidase [Saprospiraceae bacterium]
MFDVTIIGTGIVGLATGYKLLLKKPKLKVALVDKESEVSFHQTGHNSGVIHSGIYYKPGSLKALNCKKGYDELLQFSKEHEIAHEICGKVIIATRDWERPILNEIYKKGLANGLKNIRKISHEEIKEIEPHVSSVEGIWVPQTGIINFKSVAKKYKELIEERGGVFLLGEKVLEIEELQQKLKIKTSNRELFSNVAVNCAGLYADKIAEFLEKKLNLKVVPFRGEYYEIIKEKEYLVNHLIYPVPNPNFPFLGVHYTRMIGGGIEAGPNAVLAFKREGYSRWDVDFSELFETLSYNGFQKLAVKYWKTGLGELYRSYSKSAFVKALQHLIPEIKNSDLKRGGAGVRAMVVKPNGEIVDDFLFVENDNLINVINAPSPAATSSLAIGEVVADKVLRRFD